MSTGEENFDDILKSKLDETSFAFNEANWDRAEAMILAADKKRKRRIIAFIFFVGLLIGIGVMIPFLNYNDASIEKNKNIAQVKVINQNNKEEESNQSANVEQQKIEEVTQQQNFTNEVIKSEAVSDDKKEQEITLPKESTKKSLQKSEVKNTPQSKTLIAVYKSSDGNNNVESLPAKKSSDKTVVKSGSTAKTDNNKAGAEKTIITSENKTSVNKTEQNDVAVITNTSVVKESLVSENGVKKDTLPKQTVVSDSPKKDTTVVVKDSIPTEKDKLADEVFKPHTYFSIDAGANYAFGWKNNSVKEAAGFNGVFGVSVAHCFTKKWSLLIGLQYNSLGYLNFSHYTSSNIQYDFGYNESKTTITPKMLYYLAIPVKVQYHFNDKNSLSLGVNVLYLLNTTSNADVTTQSTFGSAITTTSKKSGYMDGFTTWDVQPALAYRRRIYKALNICAEFYVGLADLKNNTVFGINNAEHNSGCKLTLSYNFYHK